VNLITESINAFVNIIAKYDPGTYATHHARVWGCFCSAINIKTPCFVVEIISVAFTFISTYLNLQNILFRTVVAERTEYDPVVWCLVVDYISIY
jgi:hypothetical protein